MRKEPLFPLSLAPAHFGMTNASSGSRGRNARRGGSMITKRNWDRMEKLDLNQDSRVRTAPVRLPLPASVRNDVFLNALLETGTTRKVRRSPLEWVAAMGLHIVILAALIIIPFYTPGTIHLPTYKAPPSLYPLAP